MPRPWAPLAIALVIASLGGALAVAHAHEPSPSQTRLEAQAASDHEHGCALCSQGRIPLATFAAAPVPVAPLALWGSHSAPRAIEAAHRNGSGARSPPFHS